MNSSPSLDEADYVLIDTAVEIPSPQCVDVTIVDDLLYEETEKFTVAAIDPGLSHFIVSPTPVVISIVDNDCKKALTVNTRKKEIWVRTVTVLI